VDTAIFAQHLAKFVVWYDNLCKFFYTDCKAYRPLRSFYWRYVFSLLIAHVMVQACCCQHRKIMCMTGIDIKKQL